MSWHSRYVVFRPDEGSQALVEVFHTDDLKKAKYWIKYIAETNDALFLTPEHPRHPGGEKPCFESYKNGPQDVRREEPGWAAKYGEFKLPEAQLAAGEGAGASA